jgi:hypothetical protein
MTETMTQAFGRIGRGKKIHFAYIEGNGTNGWQQGNTGSDNWISGCLNHGGDYIGKPISYLVDSVEFAGEVELDDQQRAVAALQTKRSYIKESDICNWCFYGRYL